MTIREDIARYLRRASDMIVMGRNGSRIVLGTDRKDTPDSGFGDTSEDASEGAASIDLVAGYVEENPNWQDDKCRIYMSAKGNPDEYMAMELGGEITETEFIGMRTGQWYVKVRENIKIRNEKTTIIIDKEGNITIESPEQTKIKSGNSVFKMEKNGNISLGGDSGTTRRVLTEDDVCVGIDPTTGAIIQSSFAIGGGVTAPQATINNSKVKIVG